MFHVHRVTSVPERALPALPNTITQTCIGVSGVSRKGDEGHLRYVTAWDRADSAYLTACFARNRRSNGPGFLPQRRHPGRLDGSLQHHLFPELSHHAPVRYI